MNHIRVYKFKDAPQELKNLLTNCRNEEWIAVVPKEIHKQEQGYIEWLETSNLGSYCVDKFELDDNIIYVGCH